MAEDFDQGFEEVGLAAAVLADKDINEARAVKGQFKVVNANKAV